MTDVTLLTPEIAARYLANHPPHTPMLAACVNIRDGRAVVCPVRSEAEWRVLWRDWYKPDRVELTYDQVLSVTAWLAALRYLGLVSGEQGGGNG